MVATMALPATTDYVIELSRIGALSRMRINDLLNTGVMVLPRGGDSLANIELIRNDRTGLE